MNLPHRAVEMLDVFIGMHNKLPPDDQNGSDKVLPRIHVYAFASRSEDPVGDTVNRVAAVLKCDPTLLRYHAKGRSTDAGDSRAAVGQVVRWVTAKKAMVRLSFYLPLEVSAVII